MKAYGEVEFKLHCFLSPAIDRYKWPASLPDSLTHGEKKPTTHWIENWVSLRATLNVLVNGKAIPLQAWTGPEGSRRLRLPDFKTIGTWRWQGCQPYAPATFTPKKYSWYSFLLEAELTPGQQCCRTECFGEDRNFFALPEILSAFDQFCSP